MVIDDSMDVEDVLANLEILRNATNIIETASVNARESQARNDKLAHDLQYAVIVAVSELVFDKIEVAE